ncbi:Alpha/beta hydrolase, putative [Penicillium digitatum]|uniref:Alpha/beta hydrolase, putative n=1 Tax=Penicillium digitatum TaxID=36651 RepID=A0A7T6XP25_PENDI|nr:hypothetical protein PDIDSM_4050 [Penicillium digitatum]QQK44805.1 Alpha/beta hydrolase, putative [Penicillium digitatum]
MAFGTLFTYTPNARALKILAAAQVNRLEVSVPREFRLGVTNQSSEFLAKFPLGKVPAFEGSDGTLIFESDAIAQYVAESGPFGDKLLGKDSLEKATIRQWILFSDLEIMSPVIELVMWRVGMVPFDASVEEKAMVTLRRGLSCLECYLNGRKWLATEDDPSLADFTLAGACFWAFMQVIDSKMRDEFPILTRFYQRIIAWEDVKYVFRQATFIEERIDH